MAQLEELAAQLETQSSRLTKSIVAGSRLYDIDFRVCPRCASPVQTGREDSGHCYLCLQVPQAQLSREDLVREQERLAAQIEETATLIATRQVTLAEWSGAWQNSKPGACDSAARWLPGLLMIDGITKNVGRDEYDRARVEAVFDSLRQIGAEYGDRLQLIVAANDVPQAVADRVALRLSEEDRLIPIGAAFGSE